ncbi:MAG: hypothetical protein ABIN37_13320 [Burkholderiaceae bacterium]
MIVIVGYVVTMGCILGVFNPGRLSGFCVLRLIRAKARNDPAALADVLRLVEPLVDGGRQIGVANAPQGNGGLARGTPRCRKH